MERVVASSLNAVRTERGITQEALAEKVGVSRQTIIAIEKGKYTPSVSLALRLAKAFNMHVEDLFHLMRA
jgi:putative transcriptional regulator